MKKITILCILLLCVVTDTMAQKTVTVSGIVSDSNKEPLIGVMRGARCGDRQDPFLGRRTSRHGGA